MPKAAIIGTTSWGTTLGVVLARRGMHVKLWARTEEEAREMNQARENRALLAGVSFPHRLSATPSMEEALGGALIEALGYGVPCVATDTGGTAEIVPHEHCGYLVKREDHEALAKRIVDLMRDTDTRRLFGVNGRAHFAENFTAARCAERTGAFFDEIIERRRTRA